MSAFIPCRDDDGLGMPMAPVVCGWCQAPMGAKACRPEQAGKISHSVCPACLARETSVPLGKNHKSNDGLDEWAGRTSLNDAAAAAAGLTLPGTRQSPQANGTAESAGVMNPPQLDEHTGACPAASFTFSTLLELQAAGSLTFRTLDGGLAR